MFKAAEFHTTRHEYKKAGEDQQERCVGESRVGTDRVTSCAGRTPGPTGAFTRSGPRLRFIHQAECQN
ncbi:hypothetical protein EVAR_31564_1 [Eumeta japonica]|uniref:Uncharacterized protein n=1 Tax=Eumeta variegata TaxID=151549 RepID=A0A4C1VAR1_EUMVA|nr:hypothetical protein EVAR_31564_1 [Eumeta japonica]